MTNQEQITLRLRAEQQIKDILSDLQKKTGQRATWVNVRSEPAPQGAAEAAAQGTVLVPPAIRAVRIELREAAGDGVY